MDIYHRVTRHSDSSVLVEWEAINLSRESFEAALRSELDGFSDVFVTSTLRAYESIFEIFNKYKSKRVSATKLIILDEHEYSTFLLIEK